MYAWDMQRGAPPNEWDKRQHTLLIQGSGGMVVHLLTGAPKELKKHRPKYAEAVLTKANIR